MLTTTHHSTHERIALWESRGRPRCTRKQLNAFKHAERARGTYHGEPIRQRGDWIEVRDRFGEWVRASGIALWWQPTEIEEAE